MRALSIVLIIIAFYTSAAAQLLTREDSLSAGLSPTSRNTILSGYGEMKYSYNQNERSATANLTRNVLFIGYRFNDKITMFSELEVEDGKVDSEGGEVALEQCLIRFDFNRNNYLVAGLIIPRIGIMNENHLPVTFQGNDRPAVERMIIPATWREIGVQLYGSSQKLMGLNYSIGLTNGLNAAGISGSKGIRDARYEGRDASVTNLAVNGSLLYYVGSSRFQLSGYYGGTVGMSKSEADSLSLNGGTFGTPVALGEVNYQFNKNGFYFRGLGSYVLIQDAGKLNTAFANNAPESMYGFYGELGYNILQNARSKTKGKQLIVFGRYEQLDMMLSVPDNGVDDDLYDQKYIVGGVTYLPIRGVAIKADVKHVLTGKPNPVLHTTDDPSATAFKSSNSFYQLGIGYSF